MGKYKSNEYCEKVGCVYYSTEIGKESVCTPEGCKRTAYDFHRWLQSQNYKIVKW